MKNNIFSISRPFVPLRKFKNTSSELETECIFGESCIVLKNENDWLQCTLSRDGYKGWIKKSSVGNLINPNFKTNCLNTIMFDKPDPKSKPFFSLTFGTQVFVNFFFNNWAEVIFFNLKKAFKKYIPQNHLTEILKKESDWVGIAEKFIGIPYKWGGKSNLGVDCSGLVQVAMNFQNTPFPRNSSQQLQLGTKILELKNDNLKRQLFYEEYRNVVKRGDLLFWLGHVAIALNNKEIIHANSFHMNTTKERFDTAYERMLSHGYKDLTIKRINF